MNDVYRKLAAHLDGLPAGFPPTQSGVELRILKRLFTPQEAQMALELTMRMEPAEAIAERLQVEPETAARLLEQMARKGLIFRARKKGQVLYMAAQFVIGIWEYHVNDLDPELIADFNAYAPTLMRRAWAKQKTKQLRVIPVSESISAEMRIMPYEAAEDIIKSQSKIVVAPCICRKEHRMVGHGCDYPMETCLIFGTGADYYEENKLGRAISSQEALEILAKGQSAGLVLQPGNAQRPINICMCCGCCCQILKNLKDLPQPAKQVVSNYYAHIDPENCTACESCVQRCHMEAIAVYDTATVDPERCIGCGVCVPACEFEALRLKQKDSQALVSPPGTPLKTLLYMAKERGQVI